MNQAPPETQDSTAEGAVTETGRPNWTLGPEHPDYGFTREDWRPMPPESYRTVGRPGGASPRSTWAKPHRFRCSQCGAEKPAARTLCSCGAFRKAAP